MSVEILPCPNPGCGASCRAWKEGTRDKPSWYCACDECTYRAYPAREKSAAIAVHNAIAAAVRDHAEVGAERDALKAILADCVLGMDSWGADEDGIHPAVWHEYVRAREVLGYPVVMSGTPEEVAEGNGKYRLFASTRRDAAALAKALGTEEATR